MGTILPKEFSSPGITRPTDDSLVLWVRGQLSRRKGSVLADLSKKGNNGTIYGATYVNTPLGNSVLSFDGIDDYCDMGNDESLDITDEITVEAWVKGSASLGNAWIVSHDDVNQGVNLLYYNEHIYAEVRPANVFAIYSFALNDEVWHHLVGTYDKNAGGNDEIKLYLDGDLKATEDCSSDIGIGSDLIIGNRGGSGGEYYFNGTIDEVRIYNRALSDKEITERWQNTKYLYGY